MWINEILKAVTLTAMGQFNEANTILDDLNSKLRDLKPDADLAIALHQLGNELMKNARLDDADKAFEMTIEVRRALLKSKFDPIISNHLAGTHKTRTELRLVKLYSNQDDNIANEALFEIYEAIRIRFELLEKMEEDIHFLHDLAMTLYTQGKLEGTLMNFEMAMPSLQSAVDMMKDLVEENEDWLPDLGLCLADLVRFGVGARSEKNEPPPLKEAEECFTFYYEQLADELLTNRMVQAKYFEFLGQGAAPAAYIAGRHDRAIAFIEAGLDFIEKIRIKNGGIQNIAKLAIHLFNLPPKVIIELISKGLNQKRFYNLNQEILDYFGHK